MSGSLMSRKHHDHHHINMCNRTSEHCKVIYDFLIDQIFKVKSIILIDKENNWQCSIYAYHKSRERF